MALTFLHRFEVLGIAQGVFLAGLDIVPQRHLGFSMSLDVLA
jgi:hypothetical protein